MRNRMISLFFATFLLPSAALAGYVFEQQIDMGNVHMSMVYSVEGSNKRIDSFHEGKMVTSQISTPSLKNPLLIIHDQKEYMEQQPVSMEERKQMQQNSMKKAMEAMKSSEMSKEQKAMMESMIKKSKDQAKATEEKAKTVSPADFSVKPTDETKTVGTYKARKIEILYKGKPFQEQWVTKDLPADAGKAMIAFTDDKKLFPTANDKNKEAMKNLKAKVDEFGYPVLIISHFDKSNSDLFGPGASPKENVPNEVRIELKKVEKKSLAASEFAPPKDYKKMEMPTFK